MSYCVFAFSRFGIHMCESKEVKCIFCCTVSAKGYDLRLIIRSFQPEFRKSFFQCFKYCMCLIFILTHDDEVIRISDKIRFPFQLRFDAFLKPQIQYIVEIHICQHG